MRVAVPKTVFWRRKDVLALGIVTPWRFREAVRVGRLRGKRFPWRTYSVYRREAVIRAFRLKPCDATGGPAVADSCEFVEFVGKTRSGA